MRLEHYPIDKLKEEIRKIIGSRLPLTEYKLFFFGSRVRGDNFERADIDLGILGDDSIPPRMKMEIEEELARLPILYKIDLVNFRNAASSFKKEALKYTEAI